MRHTPIRLIILALAALAGQPVCGSFAQQSSDGGSPPVFGQQQAPAQQFFDSRDEVAVSVAPLSDAITPGSDFAIAVIFEMSPTWHIWTQPNGTPDGMAVFGGAINTEFSVDLPAGSPITLHTDQTLWPEVHGATADVGEGPQQYAVFEGRAAARIPVTIAADAAPGAYDVTFKLTFQACDDSQCLMPVWDHEIPVTINIVSGEPISADAQIFEGDFAGMSAATFTALPRQMRTPPATDDTPTKDEPATERVDDASSSDAPPPTAIGSRFFNFTLPTLEGPAGLLLLAFFGFLGGFILNLTPCVLPVIPIKIMTISKHAGTPGRSMVLGLWMALGVVMFWVGIGLPVAFVAGITDPSRVFGIWWVTFGVGLLITAMGVGIMGMFTIQLPQGVYAINPRADSASGSFLFGVMTAVLGLPCFGFVAGALLAGAATLPAGTIMIIFLSLGLGMASPYMLLSARPSLVEKIPRTGPGSELVKQVMGLLLLAAGAYFIGTGLIALVSDKPWLAKQLHWWAVAIFGSAAGLWLIIRTAVITKRALPTLVFSIVGLILGGAAVIAANNFTVKARAMYESRQAALAEMGGLPFTTSTWSDFTPDAFSRAREEGYIVVLDFTADWCLTCQALKAGVLDVDPVRSELEKDDVVFFLVDNTSSNAPGWDLLKELGQTGIPMLAVFTPGKDDPWMSNAYTNSQVVRALTDARAKQVARR